MKRGNLWMVILAGEDRGPLHSAHDEYQQDPSSLARILRVAGDFAPPARTVIIVETEHAVAARLPTEVPPESLVLLPSRCGTGVSLLTALFSILPLDPQARLIVLQPDGRTPEDLLRPAIEDALLALSRMPERLVLVGCRPSATFAPDCGWIIPAHEPSTNRDVTVAAFVEKPDDKMARQLLNGGAMVSAGIFAAEGNALLDLCASLAPRLVRDFVRWLGEDTTSNFASHIQTTPPCDFNREVLERAYGSLAMVPLPERSAPRREDPTPLGPATERQSSRFCRYIAPTKPARLLPDLR